MEVDWSSEAYFYNVLTLENEFQSDINDDGTVYTVNENSTTPVASDTAGAKLRESSDGALYIKDGDTTIPVTYSDGGAVDLTRSEQINDSLSKATKAIAVQKDGSAYKIVVEETTTLVEDSTSSSTVIYKVLDVSAVGVFDPTSCVFRTTAELNETVFGQDITGDGQVSQGSSSAGADTFADAVSTDVSQEVASKYENSAASDILSVSTSASGATEDVAMFVPSGAGGKSNVDLDVKQVQNVDDVTLAEALSDAGLDATSSTASPEATSRQVSARGSKNLQSSEEYQAVTGLLDAKLSVTDESKFGKIQSISWVLPDGTGDDATYLAKDVVTGEYSELSYNTKTGEGAQWDSTDRTLTLFVRDNGKNDENDTLGSIRVPGFVAAKKPASGSSGDSGTSTTDTTATDTTATDTTTTDTTTTDTTTTDTTTTDTTHNRHDHNRHDHNRHNHNRHNHNRQPRPQPPRPQPARPVAAAAVVVAAAVAAVAVAAAVVQRPPQRQRLPQQQPLQQHLHLLQNQSLQLSKSCLLICLMSQLISSQR